MPNKGKSSTISLIDQNFGIPVDTNEIPDYINNFFVNIGLDLENDNNLDNNNRDNIFLLDLQKHEIPDMVVTEDILPSIIQNINIFKSSSIENVNTTVLKDAFIVIIPQLVYMFQLSLNTCIFPDLWKIANVIPLQKPGDPTNVNNLRPISLLPLPGKILERSVHTQLVYYLENNNLIDVHQGGFRNQPLKLLQISLMIFY